MARFRLARDDELRQGTAARVAQRQIVDAGSFDEVNLVVAYGFLFFYVAESVCSLH